MEKILLLVDANEKTLQDFQQSFVSLGYQVLVAQNCEAGLAMLSQQSVDLVVASMQTAGKMSGHEFLKQIRALYPSTMRAVLSNFTGGKDVIACLRDGSARMYILKPWDSTKLIEQVEKLLQLGEMFSKLKLLTVFNNLNELPTMPELYGRLSDLIEKEAGLDEIARIVEHDQTVAAKLLQVANSVYYNKSTGSVQQAIAFMGLTNLKMIVLGLSVLKQMNGVNAGFFSKDVLWDHADRVNCLTHLLYEKCFGVHLKENEATAGLLHDIGRVLLIRDYGQPYTGVYQSVFRNKETTFRDSERSLMGISHDEVGGFLLNWWSLPQPIVEAAMFHHDPMNPAVIHRELVAAVHIADYYAWKQKNALMLPKLCAEAFSILGTSEGDCETLLTTERV